MKQSPITAATSPVRSGNTGAVPVPLPGAAPTPIGASSGLSTTLSPTGEAGAPNLSTPSHCPDCGTLLCDRIRDDETRMSYPCDDGESYCEPCGSLWTDDYLQGLGS